MNPISGGSSSFEYSGEKNKDEFDDDSLLEQKVQGKQVQSDGVEDINQSDTPNTISSQMIEKKTEELNLLLETRKSVSTQVFEAVQSKTKTISNNHETLISHELKANSIAKILEENQHVISNKRIFHQGAFIVPNLNNNEHKKALESEIYAILTHDNRLLIRNDELRNHVITHGIKYTGHDGQEYDGIEQLAEQDFRIEHEKVQNHIGLHSQLININNEIQRLHEENHRLQKEIEDARKQHEDLAKQTQANVGKSITTVSTKHAQSHEHDSPMHEENKKLNKENIEKTHHRLEKSEVAFRGQQVHGERRMRHKKEEEKHKATMEQIKHKEKQDNLKAQIMQQKVTEDFLKNNHKDLLDSN